MKSDKKVGRSKEKRKPEAEKLSWTQKSSRKAKAWCILSWDVLNKPGLLSQNCTTLCTQINLREGEEVTLTDNSNPEVWKVRTLSFDESDVPSIICLIPGPDADAVNLANKYVWCALKKNGGGTRRKELSGFRPLSSHRTSTSRPFLLTYGSVGPTYPRISNSFLFFKTTWFEQNPKKFSVSLNIAKSLHTSKHCILWANQLKKPIRIKRGRL